jgi:hypothetical protein
MHTNNTQRMMEVRNFDGDIVVGESLMAVSTMFDVAKVLAPPLRM